MKQLEKEKSYFLLTSRNKNGWDEILGIKATKTLKGNPTPQKIIDFCNEAKEKKQLVLGFISYDYGNKLQGIKQKLKDDIGIPKVHLEAFENYEIKKSSSIRKQLNKAPNGDNFDIKIDKDEYLENFKKIINYIKAGDIYQINYTHRLEGTTNLSTEELLRRVMMKNNAGFAALIKAAPYDILSASPEQFIEIDGRNIKTYPIKGTRPRGKNKEEDGEMKKQLIASEKEKAELSMITDLLRNDIGKISKIGSVKVKKHRAIQKNEKVWHTYSVIEGTLKNKITPIEALLSMFPGGSITGCPKKRAMEIIDELETQSRGVYTGSIGYILPNGKAKFNIAIRTIIKKDKKVYLQVGGGIVLDSKGEDEFKETLQKAKSFTDIL